MFVEVVLQERLVQTQKVLLGNRGWEDPKVLAERDQVFKCHVKALTKVRVYEVVPLDQLSEKFQILLAPRVLVKLEQVIVKDLRKDSLSHYVKMMSFLLS